MYVRYTLMTNLPVGDHHVAVINVVEGVIEGSDISGTYIKGVLVKNLALKCMLGLLW